MSTSKVSASFNKNKISFLAQDSRSAVSVGGVYEGFVDNVEFVGFVRQTRGGKMVTGWFVEKSILGFSNIPEGAFKLMFLGKIGSGEHLTGQMSKVLHNGALQHKINVTGTYHSGKLFISGMDFNLRMQKSQVLSSLVEPK